MNKQDRQFDLLMDRQGMRLAGQLHGAAAQLPHDVTERLRAGRERALASRKVEVSRPAAVLSGGAVLSRSGELSLSWGGEERMGWFGRLSSTLALCLLVFGLFGISEAQSEMRARELAEVDVALLTDDLPPAAFSDPGFLQFLQSEDL
ncbi:MAG: DUF3619 family protein [Betaproteobacteria bacterium]